MKKSIYIVVIFLSALLISSCADNKDEMMPVSPLAEKTFYTAQGIFDYLESFVELKDANIQFVGTEGGVNVIINFLSRKTPGYIFVDVEFNEQKSQLYIVPFDNEAKLFIPSSPSESEMKVKVYSIFDRPSQAMNTFPNNFKDVDKTEWHIAGSSIFINKQFPSDIRDIFVVLETRERGSVLFYLGTPDATSESVYYEIPKYGDLGIVNLKLFGYYGYLDAM